MGKGKKCWEMDEEKGLERIMAIENYIELNNYILVSQTFKPFIVKIFTICPFMNLKHIPVRWVCTVPYLL